MSGKFYDRTSSGVTVTREYEGLCEVLETFAKLEDDTTVVTARFLGDHTGRRSPGAAHLFLAVVDGERWKAMMRVDFREPHDHALPTLTNWVATDSPYRVRDRRGVVV